MKFHATSRALAALLVLGSISAAHASLLADDDDSDEGVSLIATADFNHDGVPDLAVIQQGVLTISLGNARGTHQVSVEGIPRAVVVGDFNHDGTPDVIVGSDDGSLMLYLGDGKGSVAPAGSIAHLDSIGSIAMGDFNHDGVVDIAVSDWRASTVTILAGSGSGTFVPSWSFPLRMRGTSPQISAADFNGDGIPDLAVVYGEDDPYTYDVMLGNGNGTFTISPALSTAIDPNAHCPT